jgi:hypothetical protein
MTSKVTTGSDKKELPPQDWMPTQGVWKSKLSKSAEENPDEKPEQFFREEDVPGDSSAIGKDSKEAVESINTKNTVITEEAVQTELKESTVPATFKRTSGKQRKESLEEYRVTFLHVPKLEDRKPVFVSREVRDRLDEIARRLGGRGMSVSGFIENLAMHHLEIYSEGFEVWKKL